LAKELVNKPPKTLLVTMIQAILRRQRRMRAGLKHTRLYHVFGERVLHSELWSLNLRSLAGGLSLGLFITFTPTIPFQMFLCAIGAILFRVNVFIAMATTWLTNPVTALPVYMAARQLGIYLFAESELLASALEMFKIEEGRGKMFIEQSLYLWAGSLVFSCVAATAGNLLIRFTWSSLAKARKLARRAKSDDPNASDDDFDDFDDFDALDDDDTDSVPQFDKPTGNSPTAEPPPAAEAPPPES